MRESSRGWNNQNQSRNDALKNDRTDGVAQAQLFESHGRRRQQRENSNTDATSLVRGINRHRRFIHTKYEFAGLTSHEETELHATVLTSDCQAADRLKIVACVLEYHRHFETHRWGFMERCCKDNFTICIHNGNGTSARDWVDHFGQRTFRRARTSAAIQDAILDVEHAPFA